VKWPKGEVDPACLVHRHRLACLTEATAALALQDALGRTLEDDARVIPLAVVWARRESGQYWLGVAVRKELGPEDAPTRRAWYVLVPEQSGWTALHTLAEPTNQRAAEGWPPDFTAVRENGKTPAKTS
jgi:hypothetical protein